MSEPQQRSGRSPGGIPPGSRAARARRGRDGSAVDRVRQVTFPIGLRGYERSAVDQYIADVAQLVAELEATQLRETVVQRALEEVGEQTSSILQRAHQTSDDITTRSRRQADARLEEAERHAEAVRREAEAYADAVMADSRRLWQERQRLIDEIRQFADEVLTVADDALERLPEPPAAIEGIRAASGESELDAGAAGAEPDDWASGEARPDDAPAGEGAWRDEDTASYEISGEAGWDPEGAGGWDEATLGEEVELNGNESSPPEGAALDTGEEEEALASNGVPDAELGADDTGELEAVEEGEAEGDSEAPGADAPGDDATREFPSGAPGEAGERGSGAGG